MRRGQYLKYITTRPEVFEMYKVIFQRCQGLHGRHFELVICEATSISTQTLMQIRATLMLTCQVFLLILSTDT